MQPYFALPLLLALAAFSSGSFAQTMDFEIFPDNAECPTGGNGVTQNGLSLSDNTPAPPIEVDSCVLGVNNTFITSTNGTDVFGWCGECEEPITLTLTRQDGAPFNLLSIDFSRFPDIPIPTTGTINIAGYPAGGGAPATVQVTLTSDAWVTENFDSQFNNLERVELFNESFPGINRLLDNIVTSQASAGGNPTPVPVMAPFGLLLLVAGLLLAAGGALRRR